MTALSGKVAGLPLFAWLAAAGGLAAVFFLRGRNAAAVSGAGVGQTGQLSGMPQAVFYSGGGTPGGLPAQVTPTDTTTNPPAGGTGPGTGPGTGQIPPGPPPRSRGGTGHTGDTIGKPPNPHGGGAGGPVSAGATQQLSGPAAGGGGIGLTK